MGIYIRSNYQELSTAEARVHYMNHFMSVLHPLIINAIIDGGTYVSIPSSVELYAWLQTDLEGMGYTFNTPLLQATRMVW